MDLNRDQIEKLFHLAGINLPSDMNSDDISRILIELEKKVTTSTYFESKLESENATSILIVDDLELSLHQLNLLLTKSGYNVHVARSCEEAIQQYKKTDYQFVLLDLFLPEPEDGLNLLDVISKTEKTGQNQTQIIIISGTDSKELINECYKRGANEFITKSPDWHKSILRYIRQIENQNHQYSEEIISNIENQDKKIASIKINNLDKASIAEELKKEIITLVNSGYNNIILDMQSISSIDSRGIAAIISGYRICTEQKGNIILCNVTSSVKETLSFVYLHNVIQICKDKESAISSLYDDFTKI